MKNLQLTSDRQTNQIILFYFIFFQLEILELLLKGCDAVEGLVRKVRTIQEFMLDYNFLHVNKLPLFYFYTFTMISKQRDFNKWVHLVSRPITVSDIR